MPRTAKLALQLLPAALLVWFGWGGITAPASELPNSLLRIPLFVFGVAWIVLVVVMLVRRRS